jgi:hypothetical protein
LKFVRKCPTTFCPKFFWRMQKADPFFGVPVNQALGMWKILYYFIMFFVPFIFPPFLYFTLNFLFHIKLFDILVSTPIGSAPFDPKRLRPFILYKCRCFCLWPVSVDLTHFE